MFNFSKRSTVLLSVLSFIGPGMTQAFASSTAKKAPMKKAMATKKGSSFPNTVKNPMPGEVIVKCAGISKKGMNHCGANGHSCTGQSADDDKIKDFDKNEWIYVRKEVCDATPGKIVGKKKVIKG